MSFFADGSIFARPPFKTRRSHLNDIICFSLAGFWLHFGTLKGPNRFLTFLVPRLRPKNIKINWGKSSKSIEKSPLPISCFSA